MAEARRSLNSLEQKDDFVSRHIGPDKKDQAEMLAAIGLKSLDALIDTVVPSSIRLTENLDLAEGLTEDRALKRLKKRAQMNAIYQTFIGQGYYGTITPPVILRNVLENPGWYTAYTPYQPEISQGRLEALLNFQQMVIDLTGMEIANASLLDEATAAAEAMTLARRAGTSKSNVFLVAEDCHPQTLRVLKTRAEPLDIQIETASPDAFADKDCFAALFQYPNTYGNISDYRTTINALRKNGAMAIVATDLLALTLLQPPGEFGADIVVGSAQRFGVPMGYGGPHAAFLATRDAFKRQVPGRIVGVSVDAKGNSALRLALQTREQHIRREKATSNICTAQVLLANIAGFYAVYHGPEGLTAIARRLHRLAAILKEGLRRLGFETANKTFFDTLTIETGDKTSAILHRAREKNMNLRRVSDGRVGISVDETTTRFDIKKLWQVFADTEDPGFTVDNLDEDVKDQFPPELERHSPFLTHPVFHNYRTETEMMRYLRRLEQKDIALNRSMIPLGSCTMKLNAAAEILPISWPEFAHVHPFAPRDQVPGYHQMMDELETFLCKLTGFAAVSLQPNAGSQGEYAGLLVIRAYLASKGEGRRNVCLIPASAHGTNPASAVMAGLKVVIVKCDDRGNIDIADLKEKATAHKKDLAAIMVTYPSTHGVFEDRIRDICDIVHDAGGQVYMDGANLNAMVGIALPGQFGADVMHMNLHKTFCIPHGGGGPGVGPIGVVSHLVPFLPQHDFKNTKNTTNNIGPVSAAPFGSASILPISWMYITLMGRSGLTKATQVAILNANYIARRLKDHYPILYTGNKGYVAHECILDTRGLKKSAGIEVEDIAKRLMDYGFHAPTMSFPVPGTLMIEPTESESKDELDRFCDTMLQIRAEIRKIETGEWDRQDNPLKNAPHTLDDITTDGWTREYSKETAFSPLPWVKADKYWPPVGRIDQAAGDRMLVCTCPPPEAYEDAA